MGVKTKIEWADASWNPVIGCSPVSEGCLNCYAASMASRFCQKGGYYEGGAVPLTVPPGGGWWTGRTFRKIPKFSPLTARKPRTIFVCSMGDLFHESVPDEWIDEVMAVIALADKHRYMILTKRPQRMQDYLETSGRLDNIASAAGWLMEDGDNAHDWVLTGRKWPMSNLALGVSVENRETADKRIPILLQTPAAYRFVSYEPALGPVRLDKQWRKMINGSPAYPCTESYLFDLDLVIMGGESGPNARPMHPEWARSVREQCEAAGVPFHFKQWGEWHPEPLGFSEQRQAEPKHLCWVTPDGRFSDIGIGRMEDDSLLMYRVGKKEAGRLLDGQEHNGTLN